MSKLNARLKRKARIRRKISGTLERPRLSIYKSLNHIYAQVIDDTRGHTLAYVSSRDKGVAGGEGDKKEAAKRVGQLIAERCKAAQIEAVAFDRNGFPYHGRVAAVAEAAREAGLKF
ncbi:MAG: 50S ribosomal protein L18 [Proteobacteria bacterium]|nr:50S ribosomal protein L18 [Cystobacterineae bacterium]MCL2258616.1 50S ribosomal protein L18 [Cystobacterineae bacterium]MCL2315024.1 50S ribosomal protein L18 [Pseudomonadota bacterium]